MLLVLQARVWLTVFCIYVGAQHPDDENKNTNNDNYNYNYNDNPWGRLHPIQSVCDQWVTETRKFAGQITMHPHALAQRTALIAQAAPCISPDGKEINLVLFTDRSAEQEVGVDMHYPGWRGGHSVVYKHPEEEGHHRRTSTSSSSSSPSRIDNEDFGNNEELTLGSRGWWYTTVMSSHQAETAAIAQALLTADEMLAFYARRYRPRTVKIFTDSRRALRMIMHHHNHQQHEQQQPQQHTMNNDDNNMKLGDPHWDREGDTFCLSHCLPFVRAVVAMSRHFHALGCAVELHWLPRNSVTAHELADAKATEWRRQKRHEIHHMREAEFCQQQEDDDDYEDDNNIAGHLASQVMACISQEDRERFDKSYQQERRRRELEGGLRQGALTADELREMYCLDRAIGKSAFIAGST